MPVDAVRPLRGAVLRPGQPAEAAVWPLDDAAGTAHLAAYDDEADGEAPIGVLTLLPAAYPAGGSEPAYQLRGMAVRPDLTGRGIGSVLLAAAVETARGRGARLLWCNARLPAERFYARHGFVRDGAEFTPADLGIPHVRMRLDVR